jgi:hypothetical protein
MKTKTLRSLSWAWASLILFAPALSANTPSGDPIADYRSCASEGLARIDAGIVELWRGRGTHGSGPVLTAQEQAVKCLDAALPAVNAAMSQDRNRLRALHWHYAKIKSVIALRTPDFAAETKRSYAERIAQDDATVANLWQSVLEGDIEKTELAMRRGGSVGGGPGNK